MSETIQVFPRSFALGDNPTVVATLYTDEHGDLSEAAAVADLYRLEIAEPEATGLDAEATESTPGALFLVCALGSDLTAELLAGSYFLRFRVTFEGGEVLTIPPDDRLRLRVSA